MRSVVSLFLLLAAVFTAPVQAYALDLDSPAPAEMPVPMEVTEESEIEVFHVAPDALLVPGIRVAVQPDAAWTPAMARSTPPTPPPR